MNFHRIEPDRIKQCQLERYVGDELAVALPDLREVRHALQAEGVTCTEEDRDGRLGLALLRLAGVDSAAQRLRNDDQITQSATRSRWPEGAPADMRIPDLDLVLYKLRDGFSRQYSGWVPTFGKNRVLAPIKGFPYVGGGGAGDPVLAADQSDPYVGGGGRGDPQFTGQELWKPREPKPGAGVRVAVLDTLLYPDSWLAGGYLATSHALLEPARTAVSPPKATEGHATFIAGLILHRAPGAQLYIRPVLDADAFGSVWGAAKKMVDFTGSGIDIINLSFGCYTEDGNPPLVLARAVSRISPEIVVVAAAGNHGDIDQLRAQAGGSEKFAQGLHSTTPMWPAALDDVVAVGAAEGSGQVAAFSPNLPWVDLIAPGVDIQSTYLTGDVVLESAGSHTGGAAHAVVNFKGTAVWSGTSFAAASVSGAIAAGIEPGHHTARAALDRLKHPVKGDVRPFFYTS